MNYLRIILNPTPYCNYRCLLCHREGIHPKYNESSSRLHISNTTLIDVYQASKVHGFSGLVFTGGEPLIEPRLVQLVQDFGEERTMITTNGSLLNTQFIEKLKSASLDQLNVSMCSTDSHIYSTVTRQSVHSLSSLMKSISSVISAGIKVQLNTVLYKDINSNPKDLKSILEYSINAGVARVVFIKASVPEWVGAVQKDRRNKYKDLREMIASMCSYIGCAKRGDRFSYKGNLRVILTECTDNSTMLSRVSNSDLGLDMTGFLIPTPFGRHRVPIVPGQVEQSVKSAVSLRKKYGDKL